MACVIAKWILVGKKKAGEVVPLWSQRIALDSTWQTITTLVGDYFMDMASGSFWFMLWMKLMGANVDMEHAIYIEQAVYVLACHLCNHKCTLSRYCNEQLASFFTRS